MKKIRLLALLLVILMVSSAFIFASCDNTEEDTCADGEHEWKNENNPQKRTQLQARTCTNPEIRERECKVCGKTEAYESAAPTGHKYNSTLKVYLQDATCTEDGHTVTHCTQYKICGSEKLEVLPGSALGHEYVNYVRTEDGYSSIAKCIRCDSTSEKLLGLAIDMEGDRSHLSYQSMSVYTATAENAAEYKTVTDGETSNTYLSISRPADYNGDMGIGVTLDATKVDNLLGQTYIIEADFIIDEDNTGDFILFKGVKSQLNQSMTFLKYNSAAKTIESLEGAVYKLGEDDFASGIKVSLLINDADQAYQVYINDQLASYRPVKYVGDYFSGIKLGSVEITMLGTGASTFGIDNIYLYTGAHPNGYDDTAIDGSNTNISYGVYPLTSEQSVAYKLPVETATHTEHDFTSNVVVYAPDCVIAGYSVATCPGCDGQQISNVIMATGHSWDGGVNVPANCFEAGYKVFTCGECGQKKGDQIAPAKGHTLGNDATYHDPTCMADGYTEGNCVDCGVYYIKEDKGTMTSHQLGDDTVTVKATCSVDGGVSGKCKFCGNDYTDPDTIVKAYGHYDFDFSYYTTVPATCDTDGYEEHTCLSCGEKYNENIITSTGHKTYSNVVKIDGIDHIVTKCLACSYTKTVKIFAAGSELPSYEETYNNVKDNIINSWNGSVSPGSAVISRGATWAVANEEGNSYMSFKNDPAYVIPSANGNTYWNFGLDDTHFMDEGKSVVQSFDVRLPEGKAHCGLACQLTERTVSASGGSSPKNGDAYVNIDLNGNVQLNKNNVGYKLVEGEWTRIAVVYNIVDYSVTLYINGVNKGSCQLATKYEKFNYVRMDITRTQGAEQYIDLDNMFLYYGTEPYYITQATTGPADSADIRFSSDDATYFTYQDVAQSDGTTKNFLYKLGGLQLNAKTYSEFKLVDTDEDGTTDAMSFKRNPNAGAEIGPANGKDSNNKPKVEYDTHFTLFDTANDKGVNTIHFDIQFNKVTGNYTMLQFRFEKTEGGRVDQNMLTYSYVDPTEGDDYGSIKLIGQEIYRVYEGDRIDLYLVDRGCTGAKLFDIYINGDLIIEEYDYSNESSGNINLKQATYKMFNTNGDPATTANQVDILFYELDMFNQEVIPSNYAGQGYPNVTIPGAEQTIVSFDENDSLGKLLGANSNKIPGGYIYNEIGKSYLALSTNPATAVPNGNLRYVMIDPNGNEVEEGGVWTLNASDFKTNGNPADPYFIFNKFDGVPVNADGSYDFTGFTQVIIRVYANVTKPGGYKIGVHIESPASTGSNYPKSYDQDGNVTAYYPADSWLYNATTAPTLTTGWTDIVLTVHNDVFDNGGKWSRISEINFNFSGWTYGEWNAIGHNAKCEVPNSTTNCPNTGAHYLIADGLDLYVESIRAVKAPQTLEGTGYKIDGSPCAEHSYGDPVVRAEATGCEGIGYSTQTCSVCGYVTYSVTEAAGHDYKLVEAECVKATCEADGYDVYQCSVCQIKYRVYSDKTLHNYVLKDNPTEAEGYIAAGCTTPGQEVYVCANENCDQAGKTFVVTSDPIGHKHGDDATVNEAKCAVDKTSVGECENCGENVTITYEGTALEHSITTIETSATCTEDGHKTVKCQREGCDYVESEEVLPATGHSKPADYLVTFVDRTCATYKGIKYNCLTCGELIEINEVELGKVPHVWGGWTVIKSATCGEDGYQEAYCQVCGLNISDEGTVEEKALCVILATGNHTYDETEYVYTNADDKTIEGVKYYACTTCGQAKPGSEIKVPAEYEGTAGLIFTDNKNGAYVITGYTGTATEVVVPVTYSGKPVIVGNGFVGNTTVTSITIPTGVKIADGAFKNCTALKTVNLPSDLTVLPAEVFYGCTALESITLPENCAVISSAAFYGCSKLTTVEIKATLTKVEQFAFNGCDALTTVKYKVAACPEIVISENGNDKLYDAQWIAE